MYANPGQPGQHPSQWDNQQAAHLAYPPRQEYGRPPTTTVDNMVTIPRQPNVYLPSPHDPYRGLPPDPYRPPPQQHMSFNQPAPRQRTAIACKYCRRRKIRCSGFDSSPEGRCTNCMRFRQECVFMPVSSQTQAFVPAHTAYPHLRNSAMPPRDRPLYPQNPVLFGAHGQPLTGVLPQQEVYGVSAAPGYSVPSPTTASYPSPTANGYPYDDRRDREREDSHAALLPRPLPGAPAPGRRSSGEYQYPDPTPLNVQPVSATTATPHAMPAQQPYYSTQPPRRSPPATYAYENRGSASPHGLVPVTTAAPSAYPYPTSHSPSAVPPVARLDGRTPPPPPSQPSPHQDARSGMSIRVMMNSDQGSGGRSSTDSDMLNALNRRPM